MEVFFSQLGNLDFGFKVLITFAICIVIGFVVLWFVFSILKILNAKKRTILNTQLLKHLITPARFQLAILFICSLKERVTFRAKNTINTCDVHYQIGEQLLAFIQEHYPELLPKLQQKPVLN